MTNPELCQHRYHELIQEIADINMVMEVVSKIKIAHDPKQMHEELRRKEFIMNYCYEVMEKTLQSQPRVLIMSKV